MVKRRLAGEPLQHVLGHWGFRRLDVAVDRRVLVPRPETEHVVTVALRELDRLSASGSATGSRAASAAPGLLAVDLGTGSGVIALSLVCEREAVRVDRHRPRSGRGGGRRPAICHGSRPKRRPASSSVSATGTWPCPPSLPAGST